MDIQHYLRTVWTDAGREYPYLDCWGLVLAVRSDMGLPSLPSFADVLHDDTRSITHAYRDALGQLRKTEPVPGAIAAVKRGSLCRHVGVVVESDGMLWVLEARPEGASITRIEKYQRRFFVEFWA